MKDWRRSLSLAALSALTLGFVVPASAGFEWIAPKAESQDPPTAQDMVKRIFDYEARRIEAGKLDSLRLKAIETQEFHPNTTHPATIAGQTPQKMPPLMDDQLAIAPAEKAVPPPLLPPARANTGPASPKLKHKTLTEMPIDPTLKPIVGFGAQVPLAMAMTDIVPDQFAFTFDSQVNPGALVSWEGGYRPWTIVLHQMLASHALTAEIEGVRVHIKPDARVLPAFPFAAPFVASALEINPMPVPASIETLKPPLLYTMPLSGVEASTTLYKSSSTEGVTLSASPLKPLKLSHFPLGQGAHTPPDIPPLYPTP